MTQKVCGKGARFLLKLKPPRNHDGAIQLDGCEQVVRKDVEKEECRVGSAGNGDEATRPQTSCIIVPVYAQVFMMADCSCRSCTQLRISVEEEGYRGEKMRMY